jgi:hypothetical protein
VRLAISAGSADPIRQQVCPGGKGTTAPGSATLDVVRDGKTIREAARSVKFALAAVFVATQASAATADLNSGTIVVLAFTRSKAILIADGHMIGARHKSIDNKCKIAASSGRFLFSIAGVAGGENWDAFSTARRIADAQLAEGPATRSQMMNIVNTWGAETVAWWKTIPEISVAGAFSVNGPRLMSALFCMRLDDGTIVYYVAQVLVDDPQSRHFTVDLKEQVPPAEAFRIGAFGETDIADQLLFHLPRKALLPVIRDELKRWKSLRENEETARFKAQRIVDLTIANSRYGSLVGGDINHVEMDQAGIHWQTDNAECRQ